MIKITGKVIHGANYGRKLGFPTANLDRRQYIREKMKIKFGVWAGEAQFKIKNLKFKNYLAGVVVGPVDKTGLPKLEAHLIGFKGNLYGKKITITLQKYLRSFKKFKNEEELKKQITIDIQRINLISNWPNYSPPAKTV